MVTPTDTFAVAAMERIRAQMDKELFGMFTQSYVEAKPPEPITSDTIRGWIKTVGQRAVDLAPPAFIILDKQQQRRTPVIGHYYERAEKPRTKKRNQRNCSRRKWKSMNRRQWTAVPIYEEPSDVLVLNGKTIVTPVQYQAVKNATIEINRRI